MNPGQFLAFHPEFNRFEIHIVERAIARATSRIDIKIWGNKASEGVELLAAHFLTAYFYEQAQMAGGAINLNAGQVAQIPSPTGSREDYSATSYGRQYLNLLDSLPITGIVF